MRRTPLLAILALLLTATGARSSELAACTGADGAPEHRPTEGCEFPGE